VNVQIPRECGGLGGKAIYIGMFLLVVMTNALVDHLLGC